ncbi:MAG: hypothetical protein WCQ23_07755 [Candidatus Methanomethylophilaceae archaeon]
MGRYKETRKIVISAAIPPEWADTIDSEIGPNSTRSEFVRDLIGDWHRRKTRGRKVQP